ncbi:MAG: TRAM domain-containing protein [Candidatus Bathyarchaeota archaeon]|nr:TRAM domain-containing protein [Candidatus Bathyarchaeota archaeon]
MKKSQKNAKSRGRNQVRCPLQVGDQYEVDITDATPNGVGITKIKGFMTLVPNTKVGDHKTIIITKTEHLNAEAKTVA